VNRDFAAKPYQAGSRSAHDYGHTVLSTAPTGERWTRFYAGTAGLGLLSFIWSPSVPLTVLFTIMGALMLAAWIRSAMQ
jgi:hypothetical protein